jgi:hypothetical protein
MVASSRLLGVCRQPDFVFAITCCPVDELPERSQPQSLPVHELSGRASNVSTGAKRTEPAAASCSLGRHGPTAAASMGTFRFFSSWPVIATLMNLRSRWSGIATGDQAMFVRRELFRRPGGFADQPPMENIELSRRLRVLGRPPCLRHSIRTSGRHWDAHGVWRTIGLVWRLRCWRGVSPELLVRKYR